MTVEFIEMLILIPLKVTSIGIYLCLGKLQFNKLFFKSTVYFESKTNKQKNPNSFIWRFIHFQKKGLYKN